MTTQTQSAQTTENRLARADAAMCEDAPLTAEERADMDAIYAAAAARRAAREQAAR